MAGRHSSPTTPNRWIINIGNLCCLPGRQVPGDWSGTGPHFETELRVISNMQLHLIAPLAYDAPSVAAPLRLWRHGTGA